MSKRWGVCIMDEHTAEPVLIATHEFTRNGHKGALWSMRMLENIDIPARVDIIHV